MFDPFIFTRDIIIIIIMYKKLFFTFNITSIGIKFFTFPLILHLLFFFLLLNIKFLCTYNIFVLIKFSETFFTPKNVISSIHRVTSCLFTKIFRSFLYYAVFNERASEFNIGVFPLKVLEFCLLYPSTWRALVTQKERETKKRVLLS